MNSDIVKKTFCQPNTAVYSSLLYVRSPKLCPSFWTLIIVCWQAEYRRLPLNLIRIIIHDTPLQTEKGSWTVIFLWKLFWGCTDQSGSAGCRTVCCPFHQTPTDDLVVFVRWTSHMKLESGPRMTTGLSRENYKCNCFLKWRHLFMWQHTCMFFRLQCNIFQSKLDSKYRFFTRNLF